MQILIRLKEDQIITGNILTTELQFKDGKGVEVWSNGKIDSRISSWRDLVHVSGATPNRCTYPRQN
jgi:hypothetical protein